MNNKGKVITKQVELRASKLKSKRTQLENLLRSRERLDYEIKHLKKSISRDIKQHQLEFAVLEDHHVNVNNLEVISEVMELEEGADPQESLKRAVKALKLSEEEIYLIVRVLLAFAENL